ncbi:lactonase family protein [Granulicella mallensis]|uniref:Lactonase, 7-bladed beta propeller n=1 Tax=Granulicella mallensis (strain ATCC BAA-1857 / DSM 23137 / MP5ACTX8) TaxID=682795 RepID=G8NTN6_GRAMM|nr:beta-propeller fold lactonase family protein [Granulicella mallensis]AEU36360.1 Lactonase, 7-bladed beta propeller [Granulicella mallensis MP5ACTX8]
MAIPSRQTSIRFIVALLGAATALGLTGCGNFFQCEGKPSCPASSSGGGTGTTSGDYAYVSNSTSSTSSISVFDVSTGAPLALSNSPISLGYEPTAMAITPNNSFLFVSSTVNTAVYTYSIGSTGTLSNVNGTQAAVTLNASAMDISPDSKYLYVLDFSTVGTSLDQYSIGSNGALTAVTSGFPLPLIGTSGASIKVAPTGDFLVVTLGTAGDVIVPLTNEVIDSITANPITFTTSTVGDFGVAIDENDQVYFSRTGSVSVYQVASNGGSYKEITNTAANSDTGAGNRAILVNGSNVYTANLTANNLSGFSATTAGILAQLTGSPYAGPSTVGAIGVDSSGKYLVAAGYGTAGVQVYAIGSTGALTASSTTANNGTSTSVPVVMAVTPLQ